MNRENVLNAISEQFLNNSQYIYALNEDVLAFTQLPRADSPPQQIFLVDLNDGRIFSFPCKTPKCRNSTDPTNQFVKSISISNKTSFIASACENGQIVIYEIDLHNIPQPNNSTTNQIINIESTFIPYKSKYADIQGIYCLNGNEKMLIVRNNDLISILALSHTEINQFLIETTVINIKSPISQFSLDPINNVFGFTTDLEINVLRLERCIDFILSRSKFGDFGRNICYAIDVSEAPQKKHHSEYHVIIGFKTTLHIFTIQMDHQQQDVVQNRDRQRQDVEIHLGRYFLSNTTIQQNNRSKISMIRCFIIQHKYYLLIFNNNTALLVDNDSRLLNSYHELPNCQPSDIHLFSNMLYFFEQNRITCREITIPSTET